MLALLIALLTLLGPRVWTPPAVLDQGAAPTCAVFAVEGWLETGPNARPLEPPGPLFAAAQAQEHDPPGGGTTMGAVLRVLQAEGHAGPFAVTQAPLLAQLWVALVGPITLEGRWSSGMEHADAAGAWHLTGVPWPRHAFFCYGITAGGDLRCQNSHGGLGRGTLAPADLATYLREDGYVALALPASWEGTVLEFLANYGLWIILAAALGVLGALLWYSAGARRALDHLFTLAYLAIRTVHPLDAAAATALVGALFDDSVIFLPFWLRLLFPRALIVPALVQLVLDLEAQRPAAPTPATTIKLPDLTTSAA